jgi:hypothetical protein
VCVCVCVRARIVVWVALWETGCQTTLQIRAHWAPSAGGRLWCRSRGWPQVVIVACRVGHQGVIDLMRATRASCHAAPSAAKMPATPQTHLDFSRCHDDVTPA